MSIDDNGKDEREEDNFLMEGILGVEKEVERTLRLAYL